MRVLLFAFGDDFPDGAFLQHNHVKHGLGYTGTHDSNTVRCWFKNKPSAEEKRRFYSYLGRDISGAEIPREMIRLAMMSIVDTVVIPVQDILGLGAEARMNDSSETKGKWHWRLDKDPITPTMADRFREMIESYGRN